MSEISAILSRILHSPAETRAATMDTAAAGTTAKLLVRHRRWVILSMLLSLHAGLVAAPGSDYQRIWLLVHFGLFLMWQPFVSTQQELKEFAVALIFVITGLILYFLAGWMIAAWLAILIGILGGRVFTQQAAQRSRFYLVAVFYLFAMLLVWAVPVLMLGIDNLPEGTRVLVRAFLPSVLILLVLLPFNPEGEGDGQIFDFFYSLFVFQLVVALALGSVALMRGTNNDYYSALLLTVLGFAAALFVLAILWGPRTGFGGLRIYFSRYLMSVGMPFELWMRRIAELAEHESDAARFLSSAMAETAKMPWVQGGFWESPDGPGKFGARRGFASNFKFHDLEITFLTAIRLSPALFLHVRLLAQVVGEFYEGKRREQALRQNAYLQAVHETGAKLTHDIKNLLQSMYGLTSAGEAKRDASAYAGLIERQLPNLTKRLQTTLDKLQNPAEARGMVSVPASRWWAEVQEHHADPGVRFVCSLPGDPMLPVNLFDTVLENCLENAKRKRADHPDLEIEVVLFESGGGPALSIADDGPAIDAAVVKTLFIAPAPGTSAGGLGIGLFQAGKQAEQSGYRLILAANGAPVRFELIPSE